MLPDFRNSNAFWKVSRLHPFVLLVRTALRWSAFSAGRMILTGEGSKYSGKTCPGASVSTTNPKRTCPRLNPRSLQRDRRLKAWAAINWHCIQRFSLYIIVNTRIFHQKRLSVNAVWDHNSWFCTYIHTYIYGVWMESRFLCAKSGSTCTNHKALTNWIYLLGCACSKNHTT
jgi:hypothetical protein